MKSLCIQNHLKDIFKKKLNKNCGTRRKFCWVKSVNVCLLVESFWTFFHCVDPDSHYSEYWSLPIHKEAEYGTILYPDPQHCYIFVTFCRMYTDPVLVLDFQSLYPSIIIGKLASFIGCRWDIFFSSSFFVASGLFHFCVYHISIGSVVSGTLATGIIIPTHRHVGGSYQHRL